MLPLHHHHVFLNLLLLFSHWGRVTHICARKLTIIGSDNGLSLDCRQAISRTNAGMLLIGNLRTNSSEILSEIHAFPLTMKMTMTMKTNLLPKLYKENPFKMQYMAFISKQTNKKRKTILKNQL